jgi:hypothetical protein
VSLRWSIVRCQARDDRSRTSTAKPRPKMPLTCALYLERTAMMILYDLVSPRVTADLRAWAAKDWNAMA